MFAKHRVVVFTGLSAILTWGCARGPADATRLATPVNAPAAKQEAITPTGPLPRGATPANDLNAETVQALASAATESFTQICASAKGVDAISMSLYTKACKGSDADGCLKVGALYMCGAGVEKNGPVAASMFEKACELKSDQGCQFYAAALFEGTLVPRDLPKAMNAFEKHCEHGSAQACSSIGGIYAMNGADRDWPIALAALERACTGGSADSCANLALFESKGVGSRPKNLGRAVALAKKACEDKSMFGCTVFGAFLFEGEATKKDLPAAVRLFTLACEGGHAAGCLSLAKCHYDGIGTPRDPSKAAASLRKACDSGNGQACRLLADLSLTNQPSTTPQASDVNPVMF